MNSVFTRIRVRILVIVLLAIIPAIALIYHSAAERKRQVYADIEKNTLRLSRFLASNLERDLAQGHGFLKSVALNLESASRNRDSCRAFLSELLRDTSVYSNIGLADGSGKILCSAAPIPGEAGLNGLKWFDSTATRGGFTVGFDFSGILSHQASINLAMSVPKPGSRGPGPTVFAVMNLDWLDDLVEKAQLRPGSAISVTNRSGDAVARYPDPDKWVGKPYPQEVLIDRGESGPEGARLLKGIDGVERLYAFSAVPGNANLMVRIGVRREEIYAPANQALIRQLTALGIVSLLAILAAWFGADVFLLKQVNALIAATKRLAAGNLGARSSLSYDKGELGDLARAFDEMAEKLEWREAQLSESEIERANAAMQIGEILEIAPDATLLMDENFNITAANRIAREILGYGSEDMAGSTLDSVFPDATSLRIELPPASEGQHHSTSAHFKTSGRKKNGGRFPVEVSLSKATLNRKTIAMAILRITPTDGDRGAPGEDGA